MIRTLMALAVVASLSSLKSCDHKPTPQDTSAACKVIAKLFYANGRFKFTSAEVDALSEENQIKIDAAKRFFRSCPEYQLLIKK